MNRRRMLLSTGAIVASVALALSACGATGGDSDESVLRIGYSTEPSSLVPATAYLGNDTSILNLVYDRLINFDPETGELLPDAGLASEWEFTDDTNTVFYMKIKDGITFHDGTALDADAVVASLNYARTAREEVQPLAPNDLGAVSDVQAISDNEVEITLSRPFSPLASILAGRAGMITSPTALDEFGLEAGMNGAGTGEYRVVSWNKGLDWTFERYDDYYGETPNFDRIEFTLIADEQARLNAFRSGQIDYIYEIDPAKAASLDGDDSVRVESEPNLAVSSLSLSPVGPYADPLVRQAINIAIDREAMVAAVYPSLADASSAYPSVIPVPVGHWAATESPEIVYDPEKARSLLAEAGYSSGLSLTTCLTSNDVVMTTAAEVLRTQLAEVGITLQVTLQPSTGACNTGSKDGTYGGFYATLAGRPDPYIAYTYEITVAAAGGVYPTIQAGLDNVAASADRDGQIAAYGAVNEEWQELVPVVILFTRPLLVGYNADLKGSAATFQGVPLLGRLSF
jgi:ABC-type transport system substrate-binding protein